MKEIAGLISAACTGVVLLSAITLYGQEYTPGVVAQENVTTLIKTNSCRGCDLREVNLNRVDLAGADLEGADLSRAKLYLADLAGANLRDCNLQGAGFGGADLAGADLRGADIRGASLDGAYLVGAKFDDAIRGPVVAEQQQEARKAAVVAAENATASEELPPSSDVSIGSRRDFEAAPPVLPEQQSIDTVQTGEPVAESVQKQMEETSVEADAKVVQQVVQGDATTTSLVSVADEAPAPKSVEPMQAIDVGVAQEQQQPQLTTETGSITETVQEAVEPSTAENDQDVAEAQKEPVTVEQMKAEPVDQEAAAEDLETGLDRPGAKNTVSEPEDSPTVEATLIEEETVVPGTDMSKTAIVERLLNTGKCYGCDLSGTDLSRQDLEDADLEKADLTGSNLEGADLEGANLKGATLLHANLRNANLEQADLYKADLSGSDLTGANVDEAIFEETLLYGVEGLDKSSVPLDQ